MANGAHRFLSLLKVSCPLVCLAESSRERKVTGEPHPLDPHRFGVVLVLVFNICDVMCSSLNITCFTEQFTHPVSPMTYIPLPAHVSLITDVSK